MKYRNTPRINVTLTLALKERLCREKDNNYKYTMIISSTKQNSDCRYFELVINLLRIVPVEHDLNVHIGKKYTAGFQ